MVGATPIPAAQRPCRSAVRPANAQWLVALLALAAFATGCNRPAADAPAAAAPLTPGTAQTDAPSRAASAALSAPASSVPALSAPASPPASASVPPSPTAAATPATEAQAPAASSVATAALTPTAPLPPAIVAFQKRRDACDHFRGEEPYDKQRAAFLKAQLAKTCKGSDRDLAALRQRYAGNPQALAALQDYEDRIE